MRVEIEASIIGVGAALIVWLASFLWGLYVDRRNGKRLRTMLGLEIGNNLDSLGRFHQRVEQRVTFDQSPLRNVQRLDAIRNEGLPTWSHRIWESTAQYVVSALSVEEIKLVHSLHNELDHLTEMKRDPSLRAAELETRINRLLDGGNPLK